MTRTPFLAANFKMFKTVHEAVAYAKEFRALVKNLDDVEIVVAPPFTALHAVAEASRNSIVFVAGQDVYWEKEGAFTGEVSAAMLKEAGAEFAIIGHSERRRMFGDTDEVVNRKTLAAIQGGLCPIVCVGETLEEREAQPHARGPRSAGEGRPRRPLGRAGGRPGAGLRAGLGHRHRPQRHARAGRRGARPHPRAAKQWFGADAAEKCHILYGGSVKPDNVAALAALRDIDGALVGGASLDPHGFAKIVDQLPRPPGS